MASKGELTRAHIVDSAQQLFYEHGYDGTSFSDIVAASGLVRGNIYHYFKSKDDILLAVVAQRMAEFGGLLDQMRQHHPEPRARLAALVDMIIGRHAELVQFGCPVGSLNTELAKDRRDLQASARALFDLLRDWLTDCFAELGWGEQSQRMALRFLARAQGIALIAHAYQDIDFLREEAASLKEWIGPAQPDSSSQRREPG